jgi:sugar/nucleoside kinase (ribokinase family)
MATSQTFAVVRPDGERLLLTQPGALVRLEQMIAERPLPPADVVFLTGWCQPPRVSARLLVDCLTRWRSEGRQLVFDLSWADTSWKRRDDVLMVLSRTDWALLDEEELVALTGKTDLETAMAVLRGEISQSPETPVGIVVKRGAAGAAIVCRSDISFVRAPTVRTTDTVGAGDLFNAGLLHALYAMRQVPLLAARFATTFASLSLQRKRWNLPSEADVLTEIEREESP